YSYDEKGQSGLRAASRVVPEYEVAGEDVFFCYERADRTLLRRSSHRKGYGFALLDEDTYSNDGGVRRTFSDPENDGGDLSEFTGRYVRLRRIRRQADPRQNVQNHTCSCDSHGAGDHGRSACPGG